MSIPGTRYMMGIIRLSGDYNANSPIGYNLSCIGNTYGFNIIEHTLVDCLNLSRPTRLNPYQCTLIKEFNNLLLTRNAVYRIHNFVKLCMENLIKVIAA